jgi:hypothetical protein
MLYLIALGLYQPVPGPEPSLVPQDAANGLNAFIDAHWRSHGRWSMDGSLSFQKERMEFPIRGLQIDVGGFPGVSRRRLHWPEASHGSHAPYVGGTGTTKGAMAIRERITDGRLESLYGILILYATQFAPISFKLSDVCFPTFPRRPIGIERAPSRLPIPQTSLASRNSTRVLRHSSELGLEISKAACRVSRLCLRARAGHTAGNHNRPAPLSSRDRALQLPSRCDIQDVRIF